MRVLSLNIVAESGGDPSFGGQLVLTGLGFIAFGGWLLFLRRRTPREPARPGASTAVRAFARAGYLFAGLLSVGFGLLGLLAGLMQ